MNLIEEVVSLVRGILAQQTNWFALVIGAACLFLILGLKRYLPAVPGVLVAVAADRAENRGFSVAVRPWSAAATITPNQYAVCPRLLHHFHARHNLFPRHQGGPVGDDLAHRRAGTR